MSYVLDKCRQGMRYRGSHLLVDLGWVDFDLGVPPSCPAPSAKFSDSGTLKFHVNPTQSTRTIRWDTVEKRQII